MINKITGMDSIRINNIHFRAENPTKEEKNITIPNLKSDDKGLDALAVYNEAMVKKPIVTKDKLEVEPLTPFLSSPEDSEKIEGEKIYSSDGKLNAIVKRDEDTYTVYTPDKDNENLFISIETYDKGNNRNVIKGQYNNIEDGKYQSFYIEVNDAKTGKTIRSTKYEDGNLYSASKTLIEPNGKETKIIYYYDDNEYYVRKKYPNSKDELQAIFDKNKQITSIYETKNKNSNTYYTDIYFYKGAPINIQTTHEIVIPNTMEWEKFIDNEELKPAEHFKKIENIKDIEGEKTYYSNGALETITFEQNGEKTVAAFVPEGMCYQIDTDKISVFYNDSNESITENLEDGKVKKTILYKSGIKNVSIQDGSSYKEIEYSENGKPNYYIEGIVVDGEKREQKWFDFSNGFLSHVSEYNN